MKLEEVKELTAQFLTAQSAEQERNYGEALKAMGVELGSVYQELEMTSRFVDTHRDVSYSNSAVNLHSHTFYEILSVRTAIGVEYLVGARRYKLQRGDIIIVPPGVSHRPILPEIMEVPYERDVLWVSSDFSENLVKFVSDEELLQTTVTQLIRTAGTKWSYLTEIIRWGVTEAEERKLGWEMAVCANTAHLLVHIRRAVQEKGVGTLKAEKKELMDKVLDYVEKHYREKLTLAEVAGQFFVSESTISQSFRKKMGVSFYRWVTQRRLIAAKTLIEEGRPLEQVAELVGFADYSSFYRAFKHEFGISPRQYRKMQ